MFVDCLPVDTKFDLVVIGTGFGSLFYLRKYRELNPKARILVLEWGKHYSRGWQLFNEKNSEFEPWKNYIAPYGDKPWVTNIGLGGGTNCWWALTPRMDPSDFEMKTRFGVGEDWPISYDELIPYYREAEAIMSISGSDDLEVRFPGSAPYPHPPHRLSTPDEMLKAASPRHHFPVPSARLRQPVGQRGACCSTARCHLCPVDAKFTCENSMMDVFEGENVFVLTDARVRSLDIAGDTVKGVVFEKDGACLQASGERVVLGANALQSPYILMYSGMDHPALGRYLHEKLPVEFEVMLDDVDAFDGGQATSGINFALYDSADRSKFGAATLYTENRWTNGLRPEYGRWRQVLPILVIVEDIPQASNYVAASLTDDLPTVHHPDWSPYAHKGLEVAAANLTKALGALPVESIRMVRNKMTSSHIQGTLRMGHDPATSLVDRNLVHHTVRNLTCVGTSVWSSCSTANPSLTAAALSLRAAEMAGA